MNTDKDTARAFVKAASWNCPALRERPFADVLALGQEIVSATDRGWRKNSIAKVVAEAYGISGRMADRIVSTALRVLGENL